jgi:hypothetical protein
MQTSTRTTTPRSVRLRSRSTHSISIDQEASANSTRNKDLDRKASDSWNPFATSAFERAKTSHGRSPSLSAVPLRVNRSNSVSMLSSRSKSANPLRPAAQNQELLESNRESMQALSEFLRTKARTKLGLFVAGLTS